MQSILDQIRYGTAPHVQSAACARPITIADRFRQRALDLAANLRQSHTLEHLVGRSLKRKTRFIVGDVVVIDED